MWPFIDTKRSKIVFRQETAEIYLSHSISINPTGKKILKIAVFFLDRKDSKNLSISKYNALLIAGRCSSQPGLLWYCVHLSSHSFLFLNIIYTKSFLKDKKTSLSHDVASSPLCAVFPRILTNAERKRVFVFSILHYVCLKL